MKTRTKQAQDKHRAAWGGWMTALVKAKKPEVGYPLEPAGKRVDANGTGDYYFPDTTEGGFIIINAGWADEAATIAQSSPIIKNGGYVLVRPCGEMK